MLQINNAVHVYDSEINLLLLPWCILFGRRFFGYKEKYGRKHPMFILNAYFQLIWRHIILSVVNRRLPNFYGMKIYLLDFRSYLIFCLNQDWYSEDIGIIKEYYIIQLFWKYLEYVNYVYWNNSSFNW